MIQNRDIVVFGIQSWNFEIGSNCRNIAKEMAKKNRVVYINQPLDRITYVKGKNVASNLDRISVIRGSKKSLSKIADNLWEFNPNMLYEPINRIPINNIFDFFNRKNSKHFALEISKAVEELEFKKYILFNDSSMFLGNFLNEYLDYDAYIYYIRDNLINSPYPYWNTHGKRLEELMIKKADIVVTNSVYYTDYAKKHNPNSFMVGQGCDTSLFDFKTRNIKTANDLIKIKKPIIGYVGNLTKIRLDIELIEQIAKRSPEWSIVLVGPKDDAFTKSNLNEMKNVHFLGTKPEESLPEFINGFTVCINPQKINNTTIGNYPRKIDEYLAMGKPIVATKTIAMEYFADFVYLANSIEDYLYLIKQAIKDDSSVKAESRRQFALSHTWENCLNDIWNSLPKKRK
jgi:glycosyltransferase involved in cell wall biosynthesis